MYPNTTHTYSECREFFGAWKALGNCQKKPVRLGGCNRVDCGIRRARQDTVFPSNFLFFLFLHCCCADPKVGICSLFSFTLPLSYIERRFAPKHNPHLSKCREYFRTWEALGICLKKPVRLGGCNRVDCGIRRARQDTVLRSLVGV